MDFQAFNRRLGINNDRHQNKPPRKSKSRPPSAAKQIELMNSRRNYMQPKDVKISTTLESQNLINESKSYGLNETDYTSDLNVQNDASSKSSKYTKLEIFTANTSAVIKENKNSAIPKSDYGGNPPETFESANYGW